MNNTYYRIHPTPMSAADCHGEHTSSLWTGDDVRVGLSVCASIDALVEYFAGSSIDTSPGRGARMAGCYLVELTGEVVGEGWDGEPLIAPTSVVACEPVERRFIGLWIEAIASEWETIAQYSADRDEITLLPECDDCDDGTIEYADGSTEECEYCHQRTRGTCAL